MRASREIRWQLPDKYFRIRSRDGAVATWAPTVDTAAADVKFFFTSLRVDWCRFGQVWKIIHRMINQTGKEVQRVWTKSRRIQTSWEMNKQFSTFQSAKFALFTACLNIHSLRSPHYDRSTATFKASSPQGFLFNFQHLLFSLRFIQ